MSLTWALLDGIDVCVCVCARAWRDLHSPAFSVWNARCDLNKPTHGETGESSYHCTGGAFDRCFVREAVSFREQITTRERYLSVSLLTYPRTARLVGSIRTLAAVKLLSVSVEAGARNPCIRPVHFRHAAWRPAYSIEQRILAPRRDDW